jgi:hypothetical protein
LACATYTHEPVDTLGGGGSSSSEAGSGGSASHRGSSSNGGSTATTAGTGGSIYVGGSPTQMGGMPNAGSPATGGGGAAGSAGSAGGGGAGGADMCPDDPDKTAPGKCGCGVPDQDTQLASSCIPLQNALIHRYSFEGNPNDSVGGAHGTLMGGATISGGSLQLAGAKVGQYLDLPNGLISKLDSATLETWVTWTGSAGGMWQRVFDFGSSSMPEGQAGDGNKYLFLSTVNFRACYTSATPRSEIFTDSGVAFPSNAVAHVAVVVNSTTQTMSLYLKGEAVGSIPLPLPLSAINDVNNWLGRSQYAADDYFAGTITEFRVYDAALTGAQLKTSFKLGDSSPFVEKP